VSYFSLENALNLLAYCFVKTKVEFARQRDGVSYGPPLPKKAKSTMAKIIYDGPCKLFNLRRRRFELTDESEGVNKFDCVLLDKVIDI
jgi:hypothetical protein